jgi:hypothetical protein
MPKKRIGPKKIPGKFFRGFLKPNHSRDTLTQLREKIKNIKYFFKSGVVGIKGDETPTNRFPYINLASIEKR